MKILYSTFASLLLIYAPLYSMEGQQINFYDKVADAAEDERPISFNHRKEAPIALTMERAPKGSSPHGSTTIAKDLLAMTITNGSDGYDQTDSVTPNKDLLSKIEEHKVKDKPRKKKKSTSKRIIKLFKKDEEAIKKLTNENNLFENISERQRGKLLAHYSNNAPMEELRKVFFHLKERLSKLSIKDKKDSFEYILCTTIYKTIKVLHCKGNKIEVKALLYAAGYESDEEEIIQKGLITQTFADDKVKKKQ